MPVPGTLIEGKYEIVAKIREGGMGAIYKVRHRLLDEVRVIKVMRPQITDDEEMKKRFVQEAKTVTKLKHPNIGAVLDFALDSDGTSYIVMEFIDGVTLADILKTAGPPDIPLALEIAHQTLLALGYLHRRNVVHRDVAPDNIMLTRDEDGNPRVKVIDLGIAKALDKTVEMTSTGVFLGKVKYCSPEQLGGLEKGEILDGRSDVYSLGIVLYEMLTGQRPLRGETPRELFAAHLFTPPTPFAETDPQGRVPEGVRAAVLKALEKKRQDRFASAEEFDREILRLKGLTGEVDQSDATMRMIMTVRATPFTPASFTPSAQDRLDRQFRQQATPTPMKTSGLTAVPPLTGQLDPTVSAGSPGTTGTAVPRTITSRTAADAALEPGPPPVPAPARSKLPIVIGAGVVVLAAVAFLLLRPKTVENHASVQPTAAPVAPTAAPAVPTPVAEAKVEPTAAPATGDDENRRARGPADEARGRAARARSGAEHARASELARSTFEQARGKEREAQRLFDGGNYPAAQVAFETASQLYQSAEIGAQNAVPKARPTAETIAQLNPTHAPVRPSPVAVAEPTRLPPTAPPVRPPAATDQDRIQDALHLYERAQNTLDVDLYARVYAGLTPERKQQVAQAWQGLKTQELKLDCQPPKITGTTAEVACFERRVASPRVGSEQHSDINKVMHLEKRGDAWVITSMR